MRDVLIDLIATIVLYGGAILPFWLAYKLLDLGAPRYGQDFDELRREQYDSQEAEQRFKKRRGELQRAELLYGCLPAVIGLVASFALVAFIFGNWHEIGRAIGRK